MNGLTAAKSLRRSVDQAGGVMRISVASLGDVFGRGRMTPRARTGIELVLQRAGLQVTPSLGDPENDGWVTLTPLAPGTEPPPPFRVTMPSGAPLELGEREKRRLKHLGAALAVILPALVVLWIALPESRPNPERVDAETSPRPPTLRQQAEIALRNRDYTLATRLTRQADPAAVPALRARIAKELVAQARAAQRERAYVKAIKTARRAARYGRAPGASRVIAQSRAGLDLRRAEQRRERREARRRSRASG